MWNLENEGLVLRDSLTFYQIPDEGPIEQVNLRGRVDCLHGLVVSVDKWLEVNHDRGRPEVRGYKYGYHEWFPRRVIRRTRIRDIIRVDNAHGPFHCHLFNTEDGTERIVPLELETFPSLDAFIRHAVYLGGQILQVRDSQT